MIVATESKQTAKQTAGRIWDALGHIRDTLGMYWDALGHFGHWDNLETQ